MKRFFKSDWFKCTVVLLAVILVAGGLLAILSDVLFISPEERTSRAISKLYNGEKKEYVTIIDVDGDVTDTTISTQEVEYSGQGKITKYFSVTNDGGNNDLLIQSTGYDGYKGGTVTLWVKVKVNNNVKSIDKVLIESYTKQTLMGQFSNSYFDKFQEITDIDSYFHNGQFYVATGASESMANGTLNNYISGVAKSSTAICNAVNCVIKFVGGNA